MMKRVSELLFEPARLRRIATVWLVISVIGFGAHLWMQTTASLTDGAGHPFGDDAITFWSSGRLALLGRARDVYDFGKFHAFEAGIVGHDIQLYNVAYPPLLLLILLPLGVLPFLAAWAFWLAGGWLAFALCVRRLLPDGWLLYSAALPAVFMNAISGQNGPWTAAILGWGLTLLSRRAFGAGVILSLLAFKPQLGFLIPVALLAGMRWRALTGLLLGGLAQAFTVWAAFGLPIWGDYLVRARILEKLVLEGGEGVWHRMFSAFVLFRHLGMSPAGAYVVQAVVTLSMVVIVVYVWRSPAPQQAKSSVLVLAALLATPYVTDYDLVMAGLVPLWLRQIFAACPDKVVAWRWSSVALIVAPVAAAPLALQTGAAAAGFLLVPALVLAVSSASSSFERRSLATAPEHGFKIRDRTA